MNKYIFSIKKSKEEKILLMLFKLNLLNFFSKKNKIFIFSYLVNLNIEDKYFFGNLIFNKINTKLTIYNYKDLSLISFFIYCPFIYCYMLF